MKAIDEARVIRKYICECVHCGGKGYVDEDLKAPNVRRWPCRHCNSTGVTIRKNKLRDVKAMLKRPVDKKERTYAKWK